MQAGVELRMAVAGPDQADQAGTGPFATPGLGPGIGVRRGASRARISGRAWLAASPSDGIGRAEAGRWAGKGASEVVLAMA